MIGRPELTDDPRFQEPAGFTEHQEEVQRMIADWCATQSKMEVWEAAQQLLIPCAAVLDASELADDGHLRERAFWQQSEHPTAGKVKAPGSPYRFSESRLGALRPAPGPGQDRGWPAERKRPATVREIERRRIGGAPRTGRPSPLDGVRIVEVTNNWAGPVAGRNLADLGAEVIKVESPTRIAARQGRYTGQQPFRYHYNRVSYHNKLNRNKYGVTLDLSEAEGKELFLRLVKETDVVIEDNSPRVMRNLGLPYEVLREVNPGIVMVQISAYGQTGPISDWIGVGANVEASCGLAAATGYHDDDRPFRTSLFYPDPVTATHASAAIMAALLHRDRTGLGQRIELSLQENGMAFLPEPLLEQTVAGRAPPMRGNRHVTHAPQGCYPSVGDDMWMVLCIRSDEEWRRFAEIAADGRLSDERFASEAGRMRFHDELDGIIADWTRQYDHNESSAMLQRVGIPAAPVLANWEMVSNLHAYDRGFYVMVPHNEMGAWPSPGLTWKLSHTPGEIRMPAPDYGEHNGLVFGGFLGLSSERLEDLEERRIIAGAPPPEFTPRQY